VKAPVLQILQTPKNHTNIESCYPVPFPLRTRRLLWLLCCKFTRPSATFRTAFVDLASDFFVTFLSTPIHWALLTCHLDRVTNARSTFRYISDMHVASHSSNYGYSADLDQFNKRNGKNFLLCSSFLQALFCMREGDFGICLFFVLVEGIGRFAMGRVSEQGRIGDQDSRGQGGWSQASSGRNGADFFSTAMDGVIYPVFQDGDSALGVCGCGQLPKPSR
jgi:hypothetical protein